MNITQIGRFGMLLMMASVAISCSDPNPLDSYTRVPFEKTETDDGNSDGDGDGAGGLFEKGNGTDSKPYMIMNATQIRNMRSVLKSGMKVYFQLGADIDMAGIDDWQSLNGSGDFPYEIDFDGDSHVIKNFKCSAGDYPSFFGVLCGDCRNVGFVNASVSSARQGIGIITGYLGLKDKGNGNKTGRIVNCYTIGEVIGSGAAGGIAGVLANSYDGQESYIKNCYSNATVSDQAASGGKAGGIAGRKVGVGGFIENCYAYGAVSATKGGVGGILGQIDKSCDIAIKNSAAWSNLTGVDASSTVGRIVGVSASLGNYENCYACESIVLKVNEKTITASDESSATGTTFHGVAKSAEELGNIIVAWNPNLWKKGTNGYPIFQWSE